MQHPDEGTIHAWLDGALGEEETAALTAHVDACPECAERVREARGLMAGASRIVAATDWGVGAGLPEGGARRFAAKQRSRRRRVFFTPLRSAAAAVLLVAAGTLVVTRDADRGTVAERAPASMRGADGVRATAGAASTPTTAPTPSEAAVKVAAEAKRAAPTGAAPGARAPAATSAIAAPASAPSQPATSPSQPVASPPGASKLVRSPAPASAPVVVPSTANADVVRGVVSANRPPDTAAPRRVSAAVTRVEATGAAVSALRRAREAQVVESDAYLRARAVPPAARCYEIRNDTVAAQLPRRFVLAPDGVVRHLDGRVIVAAAWRDTPDGTDIVLGAGDDAPVLHIVESDGTVSAVLREGGGSAARRVEIRRCE